MGRILLMEVRTGPDAGRAFAIEPGRDVVVGRSAPADVVIPGDGTISRRHFAASYDGRDVRIRDLGSSHGTTVNGSDVEAALVGDGDLIGVGTSLIRVRLVPQAPEHAQAVSPSAGAAPAVADAAASSTPQHAERVGGGEAGIEPDAPAFRTPPPDPGTADRVLARLRGVRAPLFAVLDAAIAPEVFLRIQECPEAKASLLEGPKAEEMAAVAPYLVALPAGSPALEPLVREGWGRSWGVFLTSDRPFEEVLARLRRLLEADSPHGGRVLFRFYDPRVLNLFLPSFEEDRRRAFFDSISAWIAEAEGALVEFALEGAALSRKAHPLPQS